MSKFNLNINGKIRDVDVDPSTPLLWILRDHLDLITIVSSRKVISRISNILKYDEIDSLKIIDVNLKHDFITGEPNKDNASYVIECLNKAADFAYKEKNSLVTGPINKKIISSQIGGFSGPGGIRAKKRLLKKEGFSF